MTKRKKLLLALGAIALLIVGALFVLSWTSKAPTNLGVTNGRLASCPDSPNCVSTQAERESQRMEPLSFFGNTAGARERLKRAIRSIPRARIVEENSDYLRVEFTSAFFRFVDDAEFLIDDERKEIHFRSAARVGYSDMGVNRTRMMTLRTAFAADDS